MRKSAEKGGGIHVVRPRRRAITAPSGAGLTRAINVQGADHPHARCAACARGSRPRDGIPRAIRSTCCNQMVTVMKGGEEGKIYKSAGNDMTSASWSLRWDGTQCATYS